MFLRRKNKKWRGIGYSYWNLCETVNFHGFWLYPFIMQIKSFFLFFQAFL